jgi:formylglycine-generating enzyme required for sulfatase activity
VSWGDAKAYTAWVSHKTGKTYNLLSESEREYVTRAGTTTPFWWGSSITPKQANYNSSYLYQGGGSKGAYAAQTVPVDSFAPNPWGLYQVHGNVWEWTDDCWNDNNRGSLDTRAARTRNSDCDRHVVRGGSWYDSPVFLRSASRGNYPTDNRSDSFGFRVARILTY